MSDLADFGHDSQTSYRRIEEQRAAASELRSLLNVTVAKTTDGAGFILDAPAHVPAVWGQRDEVLWAAGEPLMICGPQGVGKSTLAQQLVLARLSIRPAELLGLPVAIDAKRRVLYIAADRPNQIARSLRRMVTANDRVVLAERLVIHRGPLAFDITQKPRALAIWAKHHDAGTLVIDSLKDIAMPLSEDRVGASVNIALQHVIADGIEVLDLHHQRKPQAGNAQPHSLGDVYGSTWLTSGHGSVLLLRGEPGSAVIELRHLKQPAGEVGPLEVIHDHLNGTSRATRQVTALDILATSDIGLSARDVARRLLHGRDPTQAQIEKARRSLEALVGDDQATSEKGDKRTDPVTYRVKLREPPREGPRPLHAPSRTPGNTVHDGFTDLHGPASGARQPLKGGGREADREATPDEQNTYEEALALIDGDAA